MSLKPHGTVKPILGTQLEKNISLYNKLMKIPSEKFSSYGPRIMAQVMGFLSLECMMFVMVNKTDDPHKCLGLIPYFDGITLCVNSCMKELIG